MKYILIKDIQTPQQDAQAGAIFIKEGEYYRYCNIIYPASVVENSPNWFNEIHESIDWEFKYKRLMDEITRSDIRGRYHVTDMIYTEEDMKKCFYAAYDYGKYHTGMRSFDFYKIHELR